MVLLERALTSVAVLETPALHQQGVRSGGGILATGGVAHEGVHSGGSIVAALGIIAECIESERRVIEAGRNTQKAPRPQAPYSWGRP